MKVIISGGGTGGHIFPAIAIANALKKINPEVDILFVGAKGKMEMEKVPAAGYKIDGLWISGLQRRLSVDNLSFPFKVIASIMKSRKIIRQFKPDLAIGTGGFASGPLLRTAAKMNIPTLIQEQNSYPGITNKLLAKRVTKICVAYQGMEKFFPKEKIVVTGNPVRQDLIAAADKKSVARNFFNLQPDRKCLLVIGGSLGARTINESILHGLSVLADHNIQLIWQTGKLFFGTAKNALKKFEQKGMHAFDFISKMDFAYAAADMVVSRAGAISLSELAITKKPAILIPSPNVAEDHQTKNAMTLVKCDAALLVKDVDAREKLMDKILLLINNSEKQQELSGNISKLALDNAADKIAQEAIKLMTRN